MLPSLQLAFVGASLFFNTASAYFTLQHPIPLGKGSSGQTDGPCGGFNPTFEKTTDYYVGGEAVSFMTGQPEVNILIRGTLDTQAKGNWTNLHPVVNQKGKGSFCVPQIPAPREWVGQNGFIQVIQGGADVVLFACASVTFNDKRSASTTYCSNGTDVRGEFGSDARLPSDGAGFSLDASEPEEGDESETPTGSEGSQESTTEEEPESTSMAGSRLAAYSSIVGVISACILSAALLS